MFFNFLIPLSAKTPSFESILAGHLPKKLSKISLLDERGMKK